MVASGFQYCMVWATSSVTNFKEVDNKIAMTAEKLSQVTNSFPAIQRPLDSTILYRTPNEHISNIL